MNKVGFNGEFEKLKLCHIALKERIEDESLKERRIAMPNKVFALNPRHQAGLDFYRKREFRGVYLGASDRAKKYYEIHFYEGSPVSFDDTEEKKRRIQQDLVAVYQSLSDEDWNHIVSHVHWGMAKWGLAQARKKYGRK